MVSFVDVTEIELSVGSANGGIPAQLDNATRAQKENKTEIHRTLERGRPTMIENPQTI
jgi:hypothetical protein